MIENVIIAAYLIACFLNGFYGRTVRGILLRYIGLSVAMNLLVWLL